MYTFSVIIPTYNRELKLQRALDSLVAQYFKDFEVIVVNDGSTDATHLVPSLYQDYLNIKLINIVNSGGPAKPRNIGLSVATGHYICFLDSDDIWLPNKLHELFNSANQNDMPDILWHKLRIYSNNPTNIFASIRLIGFSPFTRSDGKPKSIHQSLLQFGNFIPLSSLAVSKSLIAEYTIAFNEEDIFVAWEDYQFLLDCFSKADVTHHCINKCLGYYEQGIGISSSLQRRKIILSTIAEKHFKGSSKLPLWLQLEQIKLNIISGQRTPLAICNFLFRRFLYTLSLVFA